MANEKKVKINYFDLKIPAVTFACSRDFGQKMAILLPIRRWVVRRPGLISELIQFFQCVRGGLGRLATYRLSFDFRVASRHSSGLSKEN